MIFLFSRKCLLAMLLTFICVLPLGAQDYPVRPIRLIVPIPPGGALDTTARIVVPRFSEAIGQPVVIENRVAAGGVMGTMQAAQAAPDGYTLLMIFDSFATNPSLYKAAQYDPVKDFFPIMLISRSPQVLLLHPDVPARSMKEFLSLVRSAGTKNGAGMDFATAGPGTSSRFSLELFKQVAQVDLTAVHYKGGAPAMTDLLGGQVKGMIVQVSLAIPHLKRGKLIAVAVSSAKRTPLLADVPPISDTFPGFEAQGWTGILAPAATPRSIVNKLNAALKTALAQPDVMERLEAQGSEVVGSTPEVFGTWIRGEAEKWSRIIRDLKLTLD
jgi:tripartite-type tricarboxylate transporter receptor subunit TctC